MLAPFLPAFLKLRISQDVVDDFASAFSWFADRTEQPAVFSISFGSLPALKLASDPRFADRLSRLICFGGYADLSATLEFSIAGDRRDPLNQAAAFINLLPYFEEVPTDSETLVAAWQRYLEATWGRVEMKEPANHRPISQRIGESLAPELRELFWLGTGHEPGGLVIAKKALAKLGSAGDFFDPRSGLGDVRCPVTIVHGRDDDVISVDQAALLANAFPSDADVKVILTGLYDHSRPSRRLPSIFGELSSMTAMLRALVGL